MPLWHRIRSRLTLRIRTLLVVVAVVALGLGAYLEHRRREQRRREMPYEILKAAEDGDVPRIRRLLDEGADVNSVTNGRYPWTPLMNASFHGKTDAARVLLEHGADPNRQDLDFFRAITLAAAERHWDIVRLLVEHGADVSASDGSSKTALDYAKEQHDADMARYLEASLKH
jgi:ankyrin repeat protein